METLPLDPSQATSREALVAFLEGCKLRARLEAHSQLVSISTESRSLDPLAVLESIYESDQLHFYVERKQEGMAIAGAEVATRISLSGSNRFSESKGFVEETLRHTIAVGDSTCPVFGPYFFCGFTFFDQVTEDAPFDASTVFVPRWQVTVLENRCFASANVLVDSDSEVAELADRIWKANRKFREFDSQEEVMEETSPPLEVLEESEVGGEKRFEASVNQALGEIDSGDYRKIVIARSLSLKANRPFHPLEILNTLRERYSDCYAFSIANGNGQSFIGASPERLASVTSSTLRVDVLAGTAPRGATASEDAALGNSLLRSEKDLREHAIVFESVKRRLEALGLTVDGVCAPGLKKLQNVQHLYVELSATIPPGIHLLDLVSELHPTPAVGGMPREVAVKRIPSFESQERGLYASPIGWIDAKGEGDFLVAIRSALVDDCDASLFAGVGIVDGSEPSKERCETDLKFRALKENLL